MGKSFPSVIDMHSGTLSCYQHRSLSVINISAPGHWGIPLWLGRLDAGLQNLIGSGVQSVAWDYFISHLWLCPDKFCHTNPQLSHQNSPFSVLLPALQAATVEYEGRIYNFGNTVDLNDNLYTDETFIKRNMLPTCKVPTLDMKCSHIQVTTRQAEPIVKDTASCAVGAC